MIGGQSWLESSRNDKGRLLNGLRVLRYDHHNRPMAPCSRDGRAGEESSVPVLSGGRAHRSPPTAENRHTPRGAAPRGEDSSPSTRHGGSSASGSRYLMWRRASTGDSVAICV